MVSELSKEDLKAAGIVDIHGTAYQTVAKRLKDMKEDHPRWKVTTELLHHDDERVIVKANIWGGGEIRSTGHAEEARSLSQINRTSALENAETSAVGRALALVGYAGTEIRSADEMIQAMAQQSTAEVISEYFVDYLVGEIDQCFTATTNDRGQPAVHCDDEPRLRYLLSICNEIEGDDHELKRRVWRRFQKESPVRTYINDMEKG